MFPTRLPQTDELINDLIRERQAAIRADMGASGRPRAEGVEWLKALLRRAELLPRLARGPWHVRDGQSSGHGALAFKRGSTDDTTTGRKGGSDAPRPTI